MRSLRGAGHCNRRGLTLLEVIVIIGAIVAVGAVALTLLQRSARNHCHLLHQTQAYGRLQAMFAWNAAHQGHFPHPSLLDVADATVASQGVAKNTSANIVSLMIFNQLMSPELQVDRCERGNIEADGDYQYSNPSTAQRPAEALWDPAFNADFTGTAPGNLSWALRRPTTSQLTMRAGSLSSDRPILSCRGPQMSGVGGTATAPLPIWANPTSARLRGRAANARWEGAVGYGDGHVTFEVSVFASGFRPSDAMFFDEPGADTEANDYLSIFTTAGPLRSDFTAIWD